MTQPWYNAERVSQPGSVILNEWRAARAVSASQEPQTGLTAMELANLLMDGGIAGPPISEAHAMRVSAVYACVALVAGAISTLPMLVYERTSDGRKQNDDHPYYWLLNESPNADMTAAVFWEYLVASRMFHGDCFAEIVRTSFRSAEVKGFTAHHPLRVEPFRLNGTGQVYYRVTDIDGAVRIVNQADMIHVPSLGFDGLRSPSPITYAARRAVGTASAAADYGERFFTNGARPDFAIKVQKNLSKEQADVLRATWMQRHGGVVNSHMPAVLTGGMEVERLSLSAADSKILETSMFQIEEIARVLGVPPHMIGKTDKATSWGNGIENLGRGFVKFTLARDLVKFKQEFNRKLWPVRQRYYVNWDPSDIERGDLKTENEAFRIALGRAGEPGWMTQNEVRHLKNMPPVEGGGRLFGGDASTSNDKEQPQPEKEDKTNEQEPDGPAGE